MPEKILNFEQGALRKKSVKFPIDLKNTETLSTNFQTNEIGNTFNNYNKTSNIVFSKKNSTSNTENLENFLPNSKTCGLKNSTKELCSLSPISSKSSFYDIDENHQSEDCSINDKENYYKLITENIKKNQISKKKTSETIEVDNTSLLYNRYIDNILPDNSKNCLIPEKSNLFPSKSRYLNADESKSLHAKTHNLNNATNKVSEDYSNIFRKNGLSKPMSFTADILNPQETKSNLKLKQNQILNNNFKSSSNTTNINKNNNHRLNKPSGSYYQSNNNFYTHNLNNPQNFLNQNHIQNVNFNNPYNFNQNQHQPLYQSSQIPFYSGPFPLNNQLTLNINTNQYYINEFNNQLLMQNMMYGNSLNNFQSSVNLMPDNNSRLSNHIINTNSTNKMNQYLQNSQDYSISPKLINLKFEQKEDSSNTKPNNKLILDTSNNLIKNEDHYNQNVFNLIDNIEKSDDFIEYFCSYSGCKLLQKKIYKHTITVSNFLIDKIIKLKGMQRIMTDPYANYLLQKMIENSSHSSRIAILIAIENNFSNICFDTCGTHSVQTLVSFCNTEEEIVLLNKLLRRSFKILSYDQNGVYVILKTLISLKEFQREELNEEILKNITYLVLDQQGVCVAKKFFIESPSVRKDVLVSIDDNLSDIIQHQYGNYFIQTILENSCKKLRSSILEMCLKNTMKYSIQKFSSNVIVKFYHVGSKSEKKILEKQIFDPAHLLPLIKNKYLKHMLSKCIELVPSDMIDLFINEFSKYPQLLFAHKLFLQRKTSV